jgi:hypothetical protein
MKEKIKNASVILTISVLILSLGFTFQPANAALTTLTAGQPATITQALRNLGAKRSAIVLEK